MNTRHFLDIDAISAEDLRQILDTAIKMKARAAGALSSMEKMPKSKVLAMIFEKTSTRTRISFDLAMRQLGGETIVMNSGDMQLGRGESINDTAKVLSRYVDIIMLRSNLHTTLEELATNATIPVINGLSDKSHPCQIIADIMTFEEHKGTIAGSTIAWVGDGNNVATSWVHAAEKFDFTLQLACPDEFSLPADFVENYSNVHITEDPREAVAGADCVVTDTWISMGDEDAMEYRRKVFAPYRVDSSLMNLAAQKSIFMHCLPAHRGEEVTSEVIDGPQSVVFDEAENRLHGQKAILAWCLQN
jgi:ornithine carbamoyltransferase